MSAPPPVVPLRMRQLPLLLAALAFALGIVFARNWHTAVVLVLSLLMLLCLAAVAIPRSAATGWLAVLALWTAAGCWCAQLQPPTPQQTALTAFADGLSRTVEGRIVSTRPVQSAEINRASPINATSPWLTEPGGWETDAGPSNTSIDLQVDAVEYLTPDVSTLPPTSGGVRITLVGAAPPLRCGDLVQIPVRLRTPEIYRDPGAFSYADWLLTQGIGATATTRATRLRVLQPGHATLPCALQSARRWAATRLEALPYAPALHHVPTPLRLTPDDAAMLAAMLFGDKTALTQELRAGFERTGTFHLFVVSGLHIALFSGALFWLLRRARLPTFPATLLTIALSTSYALLTGWGIPAQRALAMTSVYLLARALDRQSSGLNALGAAALLILIRDPRALYEPSFQMTALVILAVSGLGAPLAERLLTPWRTTIRRLDTPEIDPFLPPGIAARRVGLRLWGRLLRDLTRPYARFGIPRRAEQLPALAIRLALPVAELALFSIAIELCMALPMALYFHRAVPLAMPANLLIAPLATALAGFAVLTFLTGLLTPWLALAPAVLTAGLLHLVRLIIGHLGSADLSNLRVPAPPIAGIVLFALLLVTACFALRAHQPAFAFTGALAAAALLAAVLFPASPLTHPGTLELTAIDVGQGDSLFIVAPTGRTMLVDAGGPVGNLTTRWDVGEEVVAPFLWSRRIRRLDALVISHAHSDHIGGMPAVLRDLRPRELWYSIQPGESRELRALLAEAQSLGVTTRSFTAGDHFAWGGLQTSVLAPEAGYKNPGDARNNDSLVLRLDYGRASVLLEGDAEAPSEATMVANNRLAPVTLLKVGHHGSRTSTNPAFLAAVAPREAVISCGQHNTFGHPRREVLQRLEAAHIQTWRTDREGAETFLLTPDGSITAHSATYN